MKTKRDGFLSEFQDQNEKILETASRKHYGFKEKSSTQPGARFTITPSANIAARISSAKRRGFMSARPTSTQRGTEPGMKDPIRTKMDKLAKKSAKIKHSYKVPHMADLETAETKPVRTPPKPSLEAVETRERMRQEKIDEENRKLEMREQRVGKPRPAAPPRLKGENEAAYRERTELTNISNLSRLSTKIKDLSDADLKDFVARAKEAPMAKDPSMSQADPKFEKAHNSQEYAKLAGLDYPKAQRGTFALRDGAYAQAVKERGDAREARGALGILDWLAAGGVGPETQKYLDALESNEQLKHRTTSEQREAYREGISVPIIKREANPLAQFVSGPVLREIINHPNLNDDQKKFLDKLLRLPNNNSTFNLWETLHAAYGQELASGRKGVVSSILKNPSVAPFAEVWKQAPHTKVWDEERMQQHAQEQEEGAKIDSLKSFKFGAPQKTSTATQLQMESRSKRRPGSTSRTELEEFDTEPSETTDEMPGGKVTDIDQSLAEMRGMPSSLLKSRGNMEGNQIWIAIRNAMQLPEVKARVAEDLAYEDRTGKISNRSKMYFLEALNQLQSSDYPRNIPITEQEKDDIVEHMDNVFLQHQADLVNNPGNYLDASSTQFPTNMRQYLTLIRTSLPDLTDREAVNFAREVLPAGHNNRPADVRTATNYLLESRSHLQVMVEAFREIERQKYALSSKIYGSKLEGTSAKNRSQLVKQYQAISNQAQAMGKKMFRDNGILTLLQMAYTPELGNITEKYQHAAVPRTTLKSTPGFIGKDGKKENTIPNSIIAAMSKMANVPESKTAGKKGTKGIKQARLQELLPLVRPFLLSGQPIPPAFKEEIKGNEPLLKDVINMERLNNLKRISGQIDLLRTMIKTGRDPAENELPLATLQQKARDYKQLVSARDSLVAQLPEAAMKRMYQKMGFAPDEVDRYVQEVFPYPSMRGKAEKEKMYPTRGVTPPSGKRRFERQRGEFSALQATDQENLDTYIDRLNKNEDITYHSHLLEKDGERRLQIIDGLVPALTQHATNELQRYGVIDAQDVPFVYRTKDHKLALKAPDMAVPIELPEMPSFATARHLLTYKETDPISLEKRIYELKKEAKQDPMNASSKEAEIHSLELLRMFWGPMFNARDLTKFSKAPLTGKIYGPDKPIMMRDLGNPEKNLYKYTPEEQKAITDNFKASRDLLGMGIGNNAMLNQYIKSLNIDPEIFQQVMTTMKPFRSLWWSYSNDVPDEEMPAVAADSKLPYEQRIANMLASTPRGVALPTEEAARRDLDLELKGMERGTPIDPMKGLKTDADPFGKKGISELDDPGWADIRRELRDFQPEALDIEKLPTGTSEEHKQYREWLKTGPHQPSSFAIPKEHSLESQPTTPTPVKPTQSTLSGGLISDFMRNIAHARHAVKQARMQPAAAPTADPWEGQRKLMSRKRGPNQPYYRESDPTSMATDYSKGPDTAGTASSPVTTSPTLGQMKARAVEAKVPGQQTFEGQDDACDKFMRKYSMETAEKDGFSVAGRPPGGRTITGEKRMAKFYNQEGQGERKSAVLGIGHVTPQSTIKQTWKSKNIIQNKPSYQFAKRVSKLAVNSPTERNNKTDLGMNISIKPGMKKGHKKFSMKDKWDERPAQLEIDGGMIKK